MADDTTRLIISIETILKGLDKTLTGLAKVETQLKRVASVKTGGQTTAASLDKAALAAQRLQNQQQRLAIQSQRLAQQQARVDQTTERLAISQQRLAAAQQRVARTAGLQADAHVKAFRAIQRGVDDASNHVKFFKANEDALRRAPQLDAHVQAFRSIEQSIQQTNQRIIAFGNSLRSIGQGLASVGTVITSTVTVPLVAVGTVAVQAATRMDSLRRGLTAIVGSSAEAGKQLGRLTEIAKLPGIGFEEAIQGSIRLQAVGFSAAEAERNLREFANAVALTGGGRDELARVTVQLGQLAAKGKVLSQDLRPIIEAAPAVGRALKEAFGTVNADDIARLTGSSKEFLDILVTQLEKLPRAAAGAKNSFENFSDTVFRAAAAIGEALLPALTKLVEIAGPIITFIAEGFRALPEPVQAAVVALAAIAAILGPVTLLLGLMVTGVGRLVVGLAQFNAQLPATSAGLFGMATGAQAASGAMTTLRAATIGVGAAFVGLAAQLAIVIAAVALYQKLSAGSKAITDEQIAATKDQVDQLKDQLTFVTSLQTGVARTADEQQRLLEIYRSLNPEAQERVGGIRQETVDTAKLTTEVERLVQAKLREREQQIASIAGSLTDTLNLIEARKRESEAIGAQIEQNTKLIATLRANTDANDNATLRILELSAANRDLLAAQIALGEENLKSTEDAKKFAAQLKAVGVATVEQIRSIVLLRQAMGLFEGDVEATVQTLFSYITTTEKATEVTDAFTKALKAQKTELQQSGDLADKLQKERRETISDAAATAREAAKDFEGALKFMRAFIAAQPQLRAAIQREAEIQGKSFEQVIREALGERGGRQTALASAQASLAKQLEDIAKAKSEKVLAIQEQENERLLAENETAFKQQLRSYEQYLQERARLTVDSLDKEILVQAQAAAEARKTQNEILRQATRPGTPQAQRIRLQVKGSEAEERALKAETKLAELETKRDGILTSLQQTQAETALQQERDIRQLEIEYANLQGRVEGAFAVETLERFRERLEALSREQAFIGERLNLQLNGVKLVTGEERQRLEVKKQQNQREIELTNNIIRQNTALSKLQGVEQKVSDAKAEQSALESRLEFQVKFRGLAEVDAIQQRLAGEAKLRDALLEAQAIVERTIASFGTITPPKALTDALRGIRTELLGLAELDFATKFRLAQQEFDRLNDQRIQKIQQVQRAVAHRDISELQGRIAIKAANGEYIGALQKQLELLQQIAAQSGDVGLQKQAEDARTTTEEVEDATTAVADLNTELQSVAIDSLRDAFAGMGRSLLDIAKGATTAKEALLDMLDQVASRLVDVAFDRLADKLFGGLLDAGSTAASTVGGAAGQGAAGATGAATAAALQTGATTAAAALTTGGATAGTALTTGGVAAGTSIITAAAAFASTVIAAGAAFAAAVAAGAGAQAIGGLGGAVAGGAATGMFPAVPGGLIHIVEGGHPEAVLSTDPKYAARQVSILRQYLEKTRGLWGRIPQFEAGGWASASQMESNLLNSLSAGAKFRAPTPSADMQLSSPSVNLRNINLIDRGQLVSGHLRSAEGARDILNVISTERDEVGRRIGVR